MSLTVLSVAYPLAPVGPDAVGGAEQVLSSLDFALTARGHTSIVVAQEGSVVAGTLLPVPAPEGTIEDSTRDAAWATHRAAIARALEQWPVDLVHLHGIDFPSYLPDSAPTLATLHLPLDWYPASIWEPRDNLLMHCVSDSQNRTRPPGVSLLPPIPNGVPAKLLDTHQRKRDFAIMLGRVCPEKGIHLGLLAAKAANMPLLVGGRVFPYAWHENYFRQEVTPLLDDTRRFLGPLGFERKRRLLAAARCMLIPSLAQETSSLAAMEALACGTPVIAFPNGALPEVVEHGRTGFIVSSVEEMAEAMRAVDSIDPAHCKAAAAERFSVERMTDRYLEAYRAVMAARAGVPA